MTTAHNSYSRTDWTAHFVSSLLVGLVAPFMVGAHHANTTRPTRAAPYPRLP